MNVKTIKELCSEAGLVCGAYRVPLSDVQCLSILSPKGFTDPVCTLVETLLDSPIDGTDYNALCGRDEELLTLLALLRGGKTSFKSVAGVRHYLLYWPHLAWEE